MHLHGFFYRVESRGDIARDSVYWPAQRRMVVTELMRPSEHLNDAAGPVGQRLRYRGSAPGVGRVALEEKGTGRHGC